MTVIAQNDQVVTDAVGVDRQILAGQPVSADLVDAYKDAGGKVKDDQPQIRYLSDEPPLIADHDDVVTDAVGVDRQIVKGQPVPADLREGYEGKSKAQKAPSRDKAQRAPETEK